ncbi:MAG: fibronectin type III domain-containing protein [Ruminococcus sp.]|nr:fibronectin type III domain-containing protein [Ruminococcus sp.]
MKKTLFSIVLIFIFIFSVEGISAAAINNQLATPTIVDFASTEQGVKITWNPVEGAERYRVYYKNRYGDWVRMATVLGTSYTDTDVSYTKTYTYTVRCVDSAEKRFTSLYNTNGWKYTYQYPYGKPEITNMDDVSDGVRVKWSPIQGVYKYRVYYKNSKGGWTRFAETTDTFAFDTIVNNNSTYTYTVRGLSKNGNFVTDFNSSGWKHTYKYPFAKPVISSFTDDYQGVHINWTPIEGVYKYRVYYKNSKGGWTRITETFNTTAVDTDVKYNATYTYTVQGVNEYGRFVTDWNSSGWKHTYSVDTPKISAFKSTEKGVEISWNAVDGANRYRVYYKNRNGAWVRMATVLGTSYTDTDVSYTKTYTYTVRCYDSIHDRFISGYNSTGWRYTYQYPYDNPEITDFTDDLEGVHINWTPIDGVYKYRVYSKNSKGGWTRFAETTDTTALDSAVRYNATYTYTVRGLNKNDDFVTDFNNNGWEHIYSYIEPTELPTEAPTEAPLDTPSNVQAEMVDNGSVTYDSVGKWEITKCYFDDTTGASGVHDEFEYIANVTGYENSEIKPLDKERYIESEIEYSDDGSQVTIHWNKTEDKDGYSCYSYDILLFRMTESEEKAIASKNLFLAGHKVNKKWVADPVVTDSFCCTIDLPVLSETPAEAKVSWDPVDRASKYTVEVMKDGSWIVEATVSTPYYEFTPKGNTDYQFRIKAVSESGTTSAYTYKSFSTKSEFVEDEAGYSYEKPVYEKQSRTICNQCGADITYNLDSHLKANWDTCWSYRNKVLPVQIGTATIEVPAKGHWETVVIKDD